MFKKWFIFFFVLFTPFLSVCQAEEKTRTTETWSIEQNGNSSDDMVLEQSQAPEFKTAFFKMLLMLIGIIALLVLTYILFRKMAHSKMVARNQNNVIKIIEKRVLSPKSMLYLVEIGDDRVLVAESHLEVRALHYLENKPEN